MYMLGELLCIRIQYSLICKFDIDIIVQHYKYNTLTTCRILYYYLLQNVNKALENTTKDVKTTILHYSYSVTIIIIMHFQWRDP